MTTNDWERELQRLLELFERESTISLKEIKRCFDASGLSFDEHFRKYFLKVSTVRLDLSYDAVLFGHSIENQMPKAANADAPATNAPVEDQYDASIEPKMEHDAGDPIEIVDSDDEGDVEQQMQTGNEPNESGQIEADGVENLDGEYNGSIDVHSENGIEVNVEHEAKVKFESKFQIEMKDLPIVEFDPTRANETATVQMNIAATVTLNNQGQSNSSIGVQKQLKRDRVDRFKCTDCLYTSKYKSAFIRHRRIHESIKPFKCSHCNYASRNACNLARHQKVHFEGKLMGIARDPNDGLYKCTLCDQRFKETGPLSRHLTKSHKNDQRFYNCGRCMRRFVQETERESHELGCTTHRYECYICKQYVTKDKRDMQRHMRTHTGAKPFGCMICNKYFQLNGHLKRHLNSIHSRKQK